MNAMKTPIGTVLSQSKDRLGEIYSKVKLLEQVEQIFKKIASRTLVRHCQTAHYDGKTLLVIVDTPAWATKLRYLTPELITKLKQHEIFKDIEEIKCITRPKDSEHHR